ncbi:MAG: 2-amino-4-hydroxy-6-hydroxymethyldihydropteridine diphosphokinase [Planctomycetota bacterium]
MNLPARALIALGSNLGNPLLNLREALAEMNPSLGLLQKVSRFYRTRPVGGPPQDDFLNAVAILETTCSPELLLQGLLGIEQKMGRIREIKWGPRLIDLDLIFFEQEIRKTSPLTLPHPLAHERLFVLEPAVEIAPDWRHPLLKKTLSELLQDFVYATSFHKQESHL